MLAQMKQGSLKELFAKQPIVEERLKILFPQKSSHVSTCRYKSCRPWTWSPTTSSGQRSEHEAEQEEGDVRPPRPTGGTLTAGTGGFWVKEVRT